MSTTGRSSDENGRVLWVGTKSPWPTRDGGRLVAYHTIRALAEAGLALRLIAPGDPTGEDTRGRPCEADLLPIDPRSRTEALLRAALSGRPVTAERHAHAALRARVEEQLARGGCSVVHAEQPHALDACAPAFARGVPVVLRAHNVETDLWTFTGRVPGWRGWLARREAPRVGRWERDAVRRCARTIALTDEDAERLRSLAGTEAGRVSTVPPPFPSELEGAARPLPGQPAVVVMGSAGWLPNQQGGAWLEREVWPAVRAALPAARLHVFGGRGPHPVAGTRHEPPADSRDAFAPGSIHVVPLLFGSGVRMRILEAWARGVPVVATGAAASGLDARHEAELLVADTPEAIAVAIGRVANDSALARSLVAAGRARLAVRHDPHRVAQAMIRIYDEAGGSPG